CVLSRGSCHQLRRDLAPINGLTKGAANSPEAYDSHPHLHAFSRGLYTRLTRCQPSEFITSTRFAWPIIIDRWRAEWAPYCQKRCRVQSCSRSNPTSGIGGKIK